MNVKVTCCIFQKYGKPVLSFMNVWSFLLKIFPRAVQKLGIMPVLVFTFRRNHKPKIFAFDMTGLTTRELLKPSRLSLKIGKNQNCK